MDYEAICRSVIQNYPEYSSWHLRCSGYGDYKTKMTFLIEPLDGNGDEFAFAKYTVGDAEDCDKSFVDMANALKAMCHGWIDGKYQFYGWDFKDECTYDMTVVDALMQITLIGEVVYG